MGISGSQKALEYNLSGVGRAGATRASYHSPSVFIAINGVQVATTRDVDANKALYRAGLSITEVLHHTPNTAAFTMKGLEPSEGGDVVVTLGSINNYDRLYAGTILNRSHAYVGTPAAWNAPINVIDYTWHLTRRKISGLWTSTSATDIGTAIVALIPGFSAYGIVAGLPTLDTFSVTDVDCLSALTQLAKRIGGYCDVDYHKVVKLFITDTTVTNPVDLTSAHISLREFSFTRDLSQVRTRVYVIGGGVNTLAALSVGETIIPVVTTAWYNAAGGKVQINQQHVTYAGIVAGGTGSLVGPGVGPASAPTVALAAGSAGVESGAHSYAVVYRTTDDTTLSLPSPIASITTGAIAVPSVSPTIGSPTSGGAVDVGDHNYVVTFVNASGETTPSPISSTATIRQSSADPAAIGTLASFTDFSGAMSSPGAYFWAFTFIRNSDGAETALSPVTSPGGANWGGLYARIDLSGCTSAPTGYTRQWYRTAQGGSTYKRVAPSGHNINGDTGKPSGVETAGYFYDDSADAALGATAPASNGTAFSTVPLSAIQTGDPSVTSRKIYRTVAGGSTYKLATTIADNTTTTWSDTVADASLGAAAPSSNTATANHVSVSAIPIGGATVTQRWIYRTVAGGSQLKLLAKITDNTTTTYADSTADASLTTNVPSSDTSGLTQPNGQILAGAATLLVAGVSWASASGGWAVIGNGQQVIRYTGLSGNTLTGIPATGNGAITASVSYNSTVTAAPCLTGVPSSSTGSILYAVNRGDQVNLLVQCDDASAQATLGALIGGGDDGVVEDTITDGTIGETEARARGNAQLALCSTAHVSITYKSRDKNTHAGRTITVNLGAPTSVTASFLIQHVTIDNFQPALFPTYTVQASNERFSLEDLLRLARQAAA